MASSRTGHKLEDFVKIEKVGEGTYGTVFKGKIIGPSLHPYKLDSLFSQKQQDRDDRGHEEDQAGVGGRGGPQHRHQGDLPPQGAPAPEHRVSQGKRNI